MTNVIHGINFSRNRDNERFNACLRCILNLLTEKVTEDTLQLWCTTSGGTKRIAFGVLTPSGQCHLESAGTNGDELAAINTLQTTLRSLQKSTHLTSTQCRSVSKNILGGAVRGGLTSTANTLSQWTFGIVGWAEPICEELTMQILTCLGVLTEDEFLCRSEETRLSERWENMIQDYQMSTAQFDRISFEIGHLLNKVFGSRNI